MRPWCNRQERIFRRTARSCTTRESSNTSCLCASIGGGGFFLATSSDGLRWDQTDRASLVPVTFDTSLRPDPGFGARRRLDLFSCHYDLKDPAYPYQGWLFFANYGLEKEGAYFVRSRDGRQW